jgi:hypothetical protein
MLQTNKKLNSSVLTKAKDKNPIAKAVGLPKPNAGFARNFVTIADDLFTDDLR